jgi:PAS domain S-box-containing protein
VTDVRKVSDETQESARNPRPTIGLLLDWLEDRYQIAILSGVADTARDNDVNLLCFVGGRLRSPYAFDAQRNVLYDLVSRENADGLLILSGAISCEVGLEETQAFCERYRPLPMVSVALALEGIHSVTVDNEQGWHNALAHLIDVHACRRIGFIRGPEGNPEAELRYRVYTETLAQYDIPFDPDLVTVGDFQGPTGVEAIDILLDQRRVDLDAIAAANDSMAVGALEALQARGIEVGQDIAVIGFDDIEDTQAVSPPLTTVRQPLYEQGKRATEMLLTLLKNEEAPERLSLPTQLVIRQSCGCPSQATQQAALGPSARIPAEATATAPVADVLSAQQERILLEMLEMMRTHADEIDRKQAERLLAAFCDEVGGDAPEGVFLSVLDEALHQVAPSRGGMASWQGALSALRHHVFPLITDQDEFLARAEVLLDQGRVLAWEVAEQHQAYRRLQTRRQSQALEQISGALIATFDMRDLTDVVAHGLPPLSIQSCYISLFDGQETPPEWSELILAYDRTKDAKARYPRERFLARELVPNGTLPQDRRYDIVVEPLYFKDSQLGLALFEMGPREGHIYERLRSQVSSALQGALLFQQLEAERKKEREQLLAALERRALQTETAADISRAASSILDPENLVQRAVDLIRERFGLYYVGLFLVDESHEWAVLQAGTGEAGQRMLQECHRLKIGGDSMIGWCVDNKQARIALDIGEEAVRFENQLLPQTHSEIALPLISRGDVIGALTIQSSQEAAFGEGDITVLQTMADQLANAIANASLYREAQKEKELLQILMDNTLDMIYFKDADSRFVRVNRSEAQFLGLEDPDETVGKRESDFLPSEHAKRAYDEEQQVMHADHPLFNQVIEGVDFRGKKHWILQTKTPLRDESGKTTGLIGVSRDITRLKETEIEREQLLADLERRSAQLQTAAEVSHAASSILDPEELFERVVSLIHDRFDLYYAGLFLAEDEWAVLQAGTGEAGQKMLQAHHRLQIGGDSMIGWCVANKQARIALDVGEDPVRFANPLLPETRSELALPLTSRDEVIGALTIQSSHESAFTEEDITVLQSMADQLANAIANAQLYKALRWEQYLMQSLMDNVPDYVYFKDRESRFIRNSMSHARLFGVSDPALLVGKSDFDFFAEAHARKRHEDEQQIVTTGQPLVDMEEGGTLPDRREKWFLTTKVPLYDEDGNVVGTIGVTKDITERKRAEEEARRRAAQATLLYQVGQRVSGKLELDALLSEIVTAVRDAFGYHNVTMMLVDDAAEHLTLQSISGAYADLFPSDLRLAMGEGMIGNAALTGKTQLSGDVSADRHYVRKTGEATRSELAVPIRSGEVTIGVLDLQSEELDAFDETDVMVIETLADQVAAAIENARLYERAQQELVERRRAEEALARQAKALDTELEQIFYVASHHLQEPLRMVVSYSQLLQQRYEGHLDEDADELIEYAVNGATRIQALINDLLAFSRIGTRQRPLEPVDSGAIVDRALSYLKFLSKQSGAVVTRDVLPTVLADEVQLTQLFQNLIDNAIKFRSDRPLEIHVGAKRDDNRWVFSGRDNGMGIEPQYFDRIFLIFQRLHGLDRYSGTGIGLAICKKIVERHGGRIWVESEPDEGSTFYFTIPIQEQEAEESQS